VKGTEMSITDRQCSAKTTCPSTQYDAQTDKAKDAECTSLKVCTPSEYQSKPANATTDRTCSALKGCDTSTQFEKAPPTATTNRECETATVCYNATGSSAQTKYYTAYHTSTTNAECADVTDCGSGKVMTSGPTATTNRQCASRRTCAANTEYISNSEANGYSVVNSVVDSECAALTACDTTKAEVEVTAPTATSNRECSTSKAPTPAPTKPPTAKPTPAPTKPPAPAPTKAPYGTVAGSITLTGLATELNIKADGWTTALAETLSVSKDKVLDVTVTQKGKESRSLAEGGSLAVSYEVAVADETEMTAGKKSMGDFAAGGATSLTKLAAAFEKVSPGVKTLLADVTMVAKTDSVACASDTKTCPDGTKVGRINNSNSCELQPCPGSGSSDLSDGELAGAVVGGIVGFSLLVAVVVFALGGGGKGAGKPDYGDSSKPTAPEYAQKPVSYGQAEGALNPEYGQA
jgi:hypothetical protein